jgi:hypothetical protein
MDSQVTGEGDSTGFQGCSSVTLVRECQSRRFIGLNTRWIVQEATEEVYVRMEDLVNVICKLDCIGINEDVLLRWFSKCLSPFTQLCLTNK